MPRDASFWRNVGIIGLLHVAVLTGLARWSGEREEGGAHRHSLDGRRPRRTR